MSIDLSERVSRYSWAFYSGGWHRVPNPTAYYIGDASMVEYRFTTEVPLREVTVEFNTSGTVHDPLARYSPEQPARAHDTAGAEMTVRSGVNTITVTGAFLPGTEYSLWVWGTNVWTVTLGSRKAASGEIGGLGHVESGAAFESYLPYEDTGAGWVQLIPYEDNGVSWAVFG